MMPSSAIQKTDRCADRRQTATLIEDRANNTVARLSARHVYVVLHIFNPNPQLYCGYSVKIRSKGTDYAGLAYLILAKAATPGMMNDGYTLHHISTT